MAFITEDFAPWEGHLIPGGCAYYRQLLPRNVVPGSAFGKPAFLPEYGFGVQLRDDRAMFGFDTVSFKMLMAKWHPEQMRQAQALGQRIIVDVDDHYDGLHESNRAYETTDPERNPTHNRVFNDEVIRQADLVTVSTPFLFNYYVDKVKDIRLVRNGVNPEQFERLRPRNIKPVIGWVGGTGWRSNDIETCRDWLPDLLEEHDAKFLHAGYMPDAPTFVDLAGVNPDRLLVAHMLPITMYAALFQMDVGIVPLSNTPFNEAKSTIKGLEYAANGIPFVAQGLPEYRRLSAMGIGRIADTSEDWHREVSALMSYKARKRESVKAANNLGEHTIGARAHEWAEVFAEGKDQRLPAETVTLPYRRGDYPWHQ